MGFDPGELNGKDVSAFVSSSLDDGRQVRQEILKQLQAEGAWNGTLNARKKDGALFRAYTQIRPFFVSGKSYWITILRGLDQEEQGLNLPRGG